MHQNIRTAHQAQALKRSAWARAARAARLQDHGLTWVDTLGGALGGAGLHALGCAVGWALSGTWLYAGINTCGGTDLHTLGGARLYALGNTRLHTLGGAGRGALSGTGCWADLHARRGARLHADAAAGLRAHRLAGLHALGGFLHTNGRGQAGLLALLAERHTSDVLVKLKAKRRDISIQDLRPFFLSCNSQPELLKHT